MKHPEQLIVEPSCATGQATVTSVRCETEEIQACGLRGQTGTP